MEVGTTVEAPLLTSLETRILYLLAEGRRNKDIAKEIHYSPDSVATILSSKIYPKLGVTNRLDAVAEADWLGILPTPEISLDGALELAKDVGRLTTFETPETIIKFGRYERLIPSMRERMRSSDPKEASAAASFTASAIALSYAEINSQARAMCPIALDWVWENGEQNDPRLRTLPQRYGQIALLTGEISSRLYQMSINYEMEYRYDQLS